MLVLSKTMRKLLYFAMAMSLLFIVTGCQSDILSSDHLKRRSGDDLTIRAAMELPSSGTKTTLDENGHFTWNPNDAISLFYGSGTNGGSKFVSDLTSNNRISSFSGNISAVTGVSESSAEDLMFWGLYPYDAEASCDGQTVTTTLKPQQVGMADSFAPEMAPSLGRAQGLLLSFRNIYTGLYFTVSQPGFLSMSLKSNGNENIAGRAKIGFGSDGNPLVREFVDGTNEVTVFAPTAEGFEVGKKYYILFYPRTLTRGFTLELKSATETGIFRVNASFSFERNILMSAEKLNEKMSFCEEYTVDELSGLQDNTAVSLKDALVYAAGYRGFVVGDEAAENFVLVYQGPSPEIAVKKGDRVDVDAVKVTYSGVPELDAPIVTVKSSGNDLPVISYIDITTEPAYTGSAIVPVRFTGEVVVTRNTAYTFNYVYNYENRSYIFIYWPSEDLSGHEDEQAEVTGFFLFNDTRPNIMADNIVLSPARKLYTVQEVLDGSDGQYYKVSGYVRSIVNTNYGNFYISDGLSEVNQLYIFGLTNISGGYPGEYWEDLNIHEGSYVTVIGPRLTYKGTIELNKAIFISVSNSQSN